MQFAPWADPAFLDRGLKFTKGGGVDLLTLADELSTIPDVSENFP